LFNNLSEQKFQDKFGMSKNEALHGFMKRFYSDINNSNAVRTIFSKPIEKFSRIDEQTGALVFPKISELVSTETLIGGKQKVDVLTKDQQDKLRNARHDYLGAIERPDGNRSTAFPYALKLKSKGVTTLYMLESINGIPIKEVKLLEAAFKDNNDGSLDGHSAKYIPVNYTGSNISNNAFLPYSLTDEELENVTAHIQATVGKNAVENTTTPAANIDEYDDAEINAIGSTDVVDGIDGLAGLGLGAFADEAFTTPAPTPSSPKALENVKPNVAINVNANPAEKSITNIAELKGLLVQDAIFSYEGEAQMKRFDEISKMTDAELVEEALKKKLKC
jgi:hypothetical protein